MNIDSQYSNPYASIDVCNAVIEICSDRNIVLDKIKTLKLMYLCHGWHLAKYNRPLVRELFVAWKFGPVSKPAYDSMRQFEKVIPPYYTLESKNWTTGKFEKKPHNIVNEKINLIIEVCEFYGKLSSWELVDLTHKPGSPWDIVWNARDTTSRAGFFISNDAIRSYFLSGPQTGH